ncbi:hypothetical protein B7P43_G06145 [Cryptotermes secundus]|uniref:Uncharacterized protein n=1 Tax=Cryptotermes secundus TaxID=105785 RepID=A0A2J7QQ68_9NEOP|nr:hypothetical protein B7P43_G06145 [Cryptotermes secundus]
MDDEIQETVESILGKGVKVVDCEKKSCVREEEVLLVNGCPIALEGEDGAAIREALMHGTVPHCDLLNQILIRAGILRAPVRLETSLSVKSSVVTREEVTVARGGQVVDERSRETKEDNYYTSHTSEVWEPVTIVSGGAPASTRTSRTNQHSSSTPFPNSSSSSSDTSSRPTSDASTSTTGSNNKYFIPLTPNHTPANGSPLASGAQQRYYTPTAMRGGAASTSSVDSEDQVDVAKCSPYRNLRNGLQKVNIVGAGSGGTVHASDGLHQRYQKSANAEPAGVGVQTTTSAVSNTHCILVLSSFAACVCVVASHRKFQHVLNFRNGKRGFI